MPHKLVLNGFGRIGKIIYTENFRYAEKKPENLGNDIMKISDLANIIEPPVSLVECYKKVQRKYYPEKDLFIR